MKRACDCCIKKKVRCDGCNPCQRCRRTAECCSYLIPAQKRGPKPSLPATSRPEKSVRSSNGGRQKKAPLRGGTSHSGKDTLNPKGIGAPAHTATDSPCQCSENTQSRGNQISTQVLLNIIDVYRARMYPVWPVVNVEMIKIRLRDPNPDLDTYVLATALCAATMAQLHLSPIENEISAEDVEKDCIRARSVADYRTHPNINHVLSAFFLHVYHAKIDSQSAALLYIQEAIALARILKLDKTDIAQNESNIRLSNHSSILYLLLWVTERGYAIQHALPISLQETISLSSVASSNESDDCVCGLINLAELFVAFDSSSVPQFSRYGKFPVSAKRLVAVEEAISDVLPLESQSHTRSADFLVTKQWMRILLWQQALSRSLLSSVSPKHSLRFLFPARIAQDLLQCMVAFSTDQLLPLGRDQLVKLFEITNTLADIILCNPHLDTREYRKLGPSDFLHGLYQTISPFLEMDNSFNSMLREKTAEVLLRAPTRIWMLNLDNNINMGGDSAECVGIGDGFEAMEHDYLRDMSFEDAEDEDNSFSFLEADQGMSSALLDPDLFLEID